MKIPNSRSSVAFFIYCGAAVLMIVNGQPTTDDDMDRDEISKLIDMVAELRGELAKVRNEHANEINKSLARISKLEGDLAASADKNDMQPDASK